MSNKWWMLPIVAAAPRFLAQESRGVFDCLSEEECGWPRTRTHGRRSCWYSLSDILRVTCFGLPGIVTVLGRQSDLLGR